MSVEKVFAHSLNPKINYEPLLCKVLPQHLTLQKREKNVEDHILIFNYFSFEKAFADPLNSKITYE